jgi:hypothetical protein
MNDHEIYIRVSIVRKPISCDELAPNANFDAFGLVA